MEQDSWDKFYKDFRPKDYRPEICPICNTNPRYIKKVIVKDGKSIQTPDGSYYFKSNGTKEVLKDFWSCKACAKKLSAKEYNQKIIEIWNQ